MSKNTTLAAGTSPFAHLLALVTGKPIGAAKADEEKPEEGAEEEEEETSAEEEAPAEETEDEKAKRAKAKAEDEDDEEKAESEDDDDDTAKARSEGFDAAQARGRKIFSSPAAALRPDMAAHLAFNDSMPSAQAIAMLELAAGGSARASQGSRLQRRMARVVLPAPGTGGSGAKAGEKSFGELAKAAGEKAGIF